MHDVYYGELISLDDMQDKAICALWSSCEDNNQFVKDQDKITAMLMI